MPRVLIIDDLDIARTVLKEVLSVLRKYQPETGATGADLMAMLEAHDDVVAIICDHQLVCETGIEIHARIEPVLRERKIAFFLLHGSGEGLRDKHGQRYFLDRGIVELAKPFENIMALNDVIDAELARLRE